MNAHKTKDHPRERLIDALMTLAAQKPWAEISLHDVAAQAGMSLTEFRETFPSKGAVLAGFARRLDRIVLDATNDDLAGESVKDRLFDVLMRRFDAMKPYKAALRSINDWALRDPLSLTELNRMTTNSLRFMLEAAGQNSEGPLGTLKLQGLALSWIHVFHIWLGDDSEDSAKTMAALDKELERGASLVERVDEAHKRLEPLANPLIGFAERVFGGR